MALCRFQLVGTTTLSHRSFQEVTIPRPSTINGLNITRPLQLLEHFIDIFLCRSQNCVPPVLETTMLIGRTALLCYSHWTSHFTRQEKSEYERIIWVSFFDFKNTVCTRIKMCFKGNRTHVNALIVCAHQLHKPQWWSSVFSFGFHSSWIPDLWRQSNMLVFGWPSRGLMKPISRPSPNWDASWVPTPRRDKTLLCARG